MRFESLVMKNFMRYRGINEVSFSLEEGKNVTVVLGDNTAGKTTIAQAFRWCLYEKLMMPKGKRQEDHVLLNQSVLEGMDENARESVGVQLTMSDDAKKYRLCRKVTYRRLLPALQAAECSRKVQLFETDRDEAEDWEEIGSGESSPRRQEIIRGIINELLPDKLSHYFLFDGEKWSDFEYGGTRESIRESVHILTGLSSMRMAMYHLKDMNSNSVIGKFRKNVTGSGAVYDELQRDIEREARHIEKWEESLKILDGNIKSHEKSCREIEDYLIENQNTEVMQKELAALRTALQSKRERTRTAYRALVQDFSAKAYMLAAEPVIRAVLEMMRNLDLERRDIPHMRQTTIDFLLERGRCICGAPVKEGSGAYQCLMEQREYLPPADVGSLLGDFEKTAGRWTARNGDYAADLREEAEAVGASRSDLEETENRLLRLERQMDDSINFREYREQLKFHKNEILSLTGERRRTEIDIENARKTILLKEREKENLIVRNQENEKWRFRAELAKEVYERLARDYTARENKVFLELNRRLEENFHRMFNAHDKKIELDKDYNIRMYYRSENGYREENNLSEGEKVARNFAFIVTILEFNREQKAQGDRFSDTLPMVLDGPFSKLGEENIRLIAGCLPGIAEQVIVFCLEKDWEHTKLDQFVGARYRIVKNAEESFAKICRAETI